METCSVILTFASVDEILWCDHSNETSSAVRLHGTICFSIFHKMEFDIFLNFDFWHSWEFKGKLLCCSLHQQLVHSFIQCLQV